MKEEGQSLSELCKCVKIEFQTVGSWNLKERWLKDSVLVLGTERSISFWIWM